MNTCACSAVVVGSEMCWNSYSVLVVFVATCMRCVTVDSAHAGREHYCLL